MTEIAVALGERSYDIMVARGALDRAGQILNPYLQRGRAVVVTDEHVAATQLPRLEAALEGSGISLHPVILPPGEGSKSWDGLSGLVDELLALGVERSDCIIALGGVQQLRAQHDLS